MFPIPGSFRVSFSHQAISSLTSAPTSNQMSGKKIRWLFSTILFRKQIKFQINITGSEKWKWNYSISWTGSTSRFICNRARTEVGTPVSYEFRQTSSQLVGSRRFWRNNLPHRFKIYAEFVQLFFGFQSVHLVDVDRIAQVEMGKRHEDGGVEAASRCVDSAGRITLSAAAETPIVRIIRRIGKSSARSGEPVGWKAEMVHRFRVIQSNRPASTK